MSVLINFTPTPASAIWISHLDSNLSSKFAHAPLHIRMMLFALGNDGNGCHTQILSVANSLAKHFSEEEAFILLRHQADTYKKRHVQDREIREAISKAFAEALLDRSKRWGAFNPLLVAQIVSKATLTMPDELTAKFGLTATSTEGVLKNLYSEYELICFGITTKEFATANLADHLPYIADKTFIVPSPMSAKFGMTKSGKKSQKCNDNTGPRRYLVIEFDRTSESEQSAIIEHLSSIAPLKMVVHSGGKSLHAWFYCEGVDESILWQFMNRAIKLGADTVTWTPSQFVRTPGAMRDNGKDQRVIVFRDVPEQEMNLWNEWGETMPANLPSMPSFGTFDSFGSDSESENDPIPFPSDCLPPIMRTMVQEVSKASLVPDELSAIGALGVVSASIGAGLEVDSGNGILPGNLYILGIARSGVGKSRCFRPLMEPFQSVEQEKAKVFEIDILPRLKSEYAIADSERKVALKDRDADKLTSAEKKVSELESKINCKPCFSVDDTTSEALALALVNQPGQAIGHITSDARKAIQNVLGRYGNNGNSDEDLYLKGYSRESVRSRRVTRGGLNLDRPCIAVLWLVQPDAVQTMTENNAMIESGLLPRFLISQCDSIAQHEPEFPKTIDVFAEIGWGNLIRSLLERFRENGNTPTIVQTQPEARKLLRDYRNQTVDLQNGELSDIDSFVARWGENAWRIALVLHAAKHLKDAGGKTLSAETAQDAIKIMKWFAARQVNFLNMRRNQKLKENFRKIISILEEAGGSETIRNLKRSHGFSESDLQYLVRCSTSLLIETEKPPGGGRPSKRVILDLPAKTKTAKTDETP